MDQHRRAHRQSVRHALSRLCAGCLLAALGTAVMGAQAEDFVINVPVELEAMEPEVHTVQVSCYVHATGDGDAARLG